MQGDRQMDITNDIRYVGVNDHEIDLFEGQYTVPNGMAYNSYIIIDEKIAVMDTVDASFTKQWLENVSEVLGEKNPDYLIVQHMEPDHSASIIDFMKVYPQTKIVAASKAFVMMKNFFGTDFSDRQMIVSEGSKLSLGRHELNFITAPMVHWPEVIMTYDSTDKVFFSADAFGKFGALDVEDDWVDEARRYYFGIVGKYGAQVQSVLRKTAKMDIKTICPLHGPALRENTDKYIELYNIWSSYKPEEKGTFIAYTSVYGHTEKAVIALAEQLRENGCKKVVICDLARCDWSKAVENAFRYSNLVLATTTYNADIFPFMRHFIESITERGFSNRTVAFIENGSWAPLAVKVMKSMFEKSKEIIFNENCVKIVSALNDESLAQISALANEIAKGFAEENEPPKKIRRFECTLCGFVYEGEYLPEDYVCPICQLGKEAFEEIK